MINTYWEWLASCKSIYFSFDNNSLRFKFLKTARFRVTRKDENSAKTKQCCKKKTVLQKENSAAKRKQFCEKCCEKANSVAKSRNTNDRNKSQTSGKLKEWSWIIIHLKWYFQKMWKNMCYNVSIIFLTTQRSSTTQRYDLEKVVLLFLFIFSLSWRLRWQVPKWIILIKYFNNNSSNNNNNPFYTVIGASLNITFAWT